MRRRLKWISIIFGSVLGIVVTVVAILVIIGGSKLTKQYEVQPAPVTVSNDPAVIQRGQYLVSASCTGCHGENLGGQAFVDDPGLGRIPAPNLTGGRGGAGAEFSDIDFVRAIRHGVDNTGQPLAIMPSQAYWHFSDDDLGAIIAYVKSVPPVANAMGEKNVRLLGRLLLGAGTLDILAAESINHTGPRPAAPAPMVAAGYGQYLANTGDCRNCHGPDLSGAPPAEPGGLPGPDLTRGGQVANWTIEEFITTMRTGVTPNGHRLNPEFMPWEAYGRLTDDDLTALFLYLQSLDTAASAME